MSDQCSEERFLHDIKSHNMAVHLDEGLHRHLSFSRNGSSIYRFDLLTWPGHLTITGDCGTYTFQRVPDMFDFFRTDEDYKRTHLDRMLHINPPYWGQKLLSVCKQGGYHEYDETEFAERVARQFEQYWEHAVWYTDLSTDMAEMWETIEQDVLSLADSEHDAYDAVNSFRYRDFQFQDFFDAGGTEAYTYHYLWCLYAIVSGIETYDAYKAAAKQKQREKDVEKVLDNLNGQEK